MLIICREDFQPGHSRNSVLQVRASFRLGSECEHGVLRLDERLVFEAGDEVGDRDAEVRVAEERPVAVIGLDPQRTVALFRERRLKKYL